MIKIEPGSVIKMRWYISRRLPATPLHHPT